MQTQLPRRTICLLGGTGFIGRHVAGRLVALGHDVTVLTRARDRHKDMLVLPTARLLQGDPYSATELVSAMRRADSVVNLIGIANERGRDGRGFHRAHVECTEKALAACRDAGIRRFIQMSALRADPAGSSHYLRSKGVAEEHVRESDLDWTILQPSIVFGREDDFINRFGRLLRRLPVLPLAKANTRLAPVFVGDVAAAVVRSLEEPGASHQTFQLCGPQVYSLREIVRLIGRLAGKERPVLRLSPTLGKIQARLMEFFPGKPFSSDNFLTLSTHNICDSGAPGLTDLGIVPTHLEPEVSRYLRIGTVD